MTTLTYSLSGGAKSVLITCVAIQTLTALIALVIPQGSTHSGAGQ
jgi:hypothetical protein